MASYGRLIAGPGTVVLGSALVARGRGSVARAHYVRRGGSRSSDGLGARLSGRSKCGSLCLRASALASGDAHGAKALEGSTQLGACDSMPKHALVGDPLLGGPRRDFSAPRALGDRLGAAHRVLGDRAVLGRGCAVLFPCSSPPRLRGHEIEGPGRPTRSGPLHFSTRASAGTRPQRAGPEEPYPDESGRRQTDSVRNSSVPWLHVLGQ